MKRYLFLLSFVIAVSCNDQQPVTGNTQPDTVNLQPVTSNPQPATSNPVTSSLQPPLLACLLSEISYCSSQQDSLSKYVPGWKIIWSPAAVNGNHAFLATNDTDYALSIRGSLIGFSEDAFNNWIKQDLNVAEQALWPYAASQKAVVSAGSFSAWYNISMMKDGKGFTLLKMLDSVCHDGTRLLITGHSLGGNLSTVVASWIDEHFKKQNIVHPDINVITFAAPAAGNAAFAENYNSRFPHSIRYENVNDIVPKFPVSDRISELGGLFHAGPDAGKIKVGYAILKVDLSTVFTGVGVTLRGISLRTGYYPYLQTNGNGTVIQVPLSGKNNNQEASAWFAEAGYQHSIEQYAKAMGVPVIHVP